MTRRLAPHVGIIALTVALAVAGLLLLSYNNRHSIAYAAASTDSHLQIAPANSTAWDNSVGAAWTLTNAAPGDSASGGVMLHTTGTFDPATVSLHVSAATPPGSPSPLAAQLLITEMHLGSANLLPPWAAACSTGGRLTLATLLTCTTLPGFALPDERGELFTMTLTLDPAAGNAYQGGNASDITIELTLDQSAATPSATSTASPPPATSPSSTTTPLHTASATPSAIATATSTGTAYPASRTATTTQPSASVTVSPTATNTQPSAATTPAAPNSGSGDGSHHALGITLLGIALLIASAWLATVVALRRR